MGRWGHWGLGSWFFLLIGGQALVMDWHPDRAKDPELSTKVFQWLQAIETAAETAAGGKGLFVSSSVYGEVPSGYVKIAIENGHL